MQQFNYFRPPKWLDFQLSSIKTYRLESSFWRPHFDSWYTFAQNISEKYNMPEKHKIPPNSTWKAMIPTQTWKAKTSVACEDFCITYPFGSNGAEICEDCNTIYDDAGKALSYKDAVVIGKPIEILPFETFKVELTWPTATSAAPSFAPSLDGVLVKKLRCECDSKMLFNFGCQCGGS